MGEPNPFSVATRASLLPVSRGTARGIAHESATFVQRGHALPPSFFARHDEGTSTTPHPFVPSPRSTWNSKGPAHEHVASVQRDHELAPSRSAENGGGTALEQATPVSTTACASIFLFHVERPDQGG